MTNENAADQPIFVEAAVVGNVSGFVVGPLFCMNLFVFFDFFLISCVYLRCKRTSSISSSYASPVSLYDKMEIKQLLMQIVKSG